MRILSDLQNSLSLAARRQSSSLEEGASPLCRCATSLPKGETSWVVRKTKAFLPEEGGTAQAVTEGAAHEQVCIRANLKSHVSRFQPSLSLRDISPEGRDKFGLRVRANSHFCMRLNSRYPCKIREAATASTFFLCFFCFLPEACKIAWASMVVRRSSQ